MNSSCIIFLDNSINKIFKTIELLKKNYENLHVFNQEKDFFDHLEITEPEIILLNLDLQPNDGVAILKEIKNRKIKTEPYVIIYSDKQDDFVHELAYNTGADSFINFHAKAAVMELYIGNLLRRRILQHPPQIKRDLMIDVESYLIYKNGKPIQLPRKEFKLFELLFNNSGKFFSKPEIAVTLWNDAAIANKRIIDVHIYNIRQFFGKQIIQSQKGKGYRLNRKQIT